MGLIKSIGLKLAGIKQTPYGYAVTTGLGQDMWSKRDYANFAKEAYIENFVGFRCIDFISQSVGSVPWEVYKKMDDSREEIEDDQNPIKRILHRANPRTSFSMYNYAVMAYYLIAGNAYLEKIGPETGVNSGVPTELQYYPPNKIKFLTDKEEGLIGYAYIENGQEVKRWEIDLITQQCDLLHLKTFHPLSQIEGMSKVEPAAKSIDTSNEALSWNKSLLQNQGRPGMIFSYEGTLSEKQFERLQNQLNAKFSGPDNAGRNLVAEGELKDVKPYGFNPTEMDFLQGNWDLVRQICITYGVPPQLLGVPGDSTFANFEQAMEFYCEFTWEWYLKLLRGEYNNWLYPDSDELFIDYCLDDVPAFEYQRKQKWEKVKNADFMTVNEKREEVGLDKVDGGDVILINSTQIPLDTVGVSEEEVDDSENDIVEDEDIDEELQAELLNLKADEFFDSLKIKTKKLKAL